MNRKIVSLDSEQTNQAEFKAALEHFYSSSDDETADNFFYQCARAIIRAYQAGEALVLPLAFVQAIEEESEEETPESD
jgi:hypothetical protein